MFKSMHYVGNFSSEDLAYFVFWGACLSLSEGGPSLEINSPKVLLSCLESEASEQAKMILLQNIWDAAEVFEENLSTNKE